MTWRRRARTLAVTAVMAAASAQSTPYITLPGSQAYSVWGSAAAADDIIHAAWGSLGGSGVQYSRSTDRGRSWLPTPITVPGAGGALAVSGPHVYLASPLQCASSIDGGLTWRPPSQVMPVNATAAAFFADGATLHALLGTGSGTLFYNHSTDGGLTWMASPVVLGNYTYPAFQLAVVGNTVHIVWKGTTDIRYSRSADGGQTWQPAQMLSQVSSLSGAGFALLATGPNVLVALCTFPSGPLSLVRSVDDGVTWLNPVVLGQGRGAAGAAAGNGVCFAWTSGSSPTTVFLAASVDAGITWQVQSQQVWFQTLNTFISSFVYRNATIALALECVDYFLPAYMAYPGAVIVSNDRGASWLQSPQIEQMFVRGVRFPQLLPVNDSLALVWGSSPSGSVGAADEIRSSLLFGYQPYGSAKAGTGNQAPRLDGNGEPHTGSTVGIAMSNGRGGSLALIAATFAGPASVPFGSGTLLVQPPTINVVGVTTGAQGVPGAGSLAFQIAIPTGGSFRNQRLDFQGFVLDPVAADGFASTAGLELWTF